MSGTGQAEADTNSGKAVKWRRQWKRSKRKTMRRWRSFWRHIDLRLAWLVAVLTFAGAVALIIVQLRGDGASPDSTTLGLFVLAGLAGFAFLSPRQAGKAMRRITRFKVAGVELGLTEIKRAERIRPPEEDDGVKPERRRGKGYRECVRRLENRLVRVHGMLHLDARKKDRVEIAEELRRKELLTRDEETFVVELLQNHDPTYEDWSTATEEEFLDVTWAFATRFRSLVWDRYVRGKLEDDGWFIVNYEQKRGHRPDFLAYRENRWVLVAARVGSLGERKPDLLDVAVKRLAKPRKGPDISRRAVVLPDLSRGVISDEVSKDVREAVELLTLEEFRDDGLSPDGAPEG